MYICMHTPWFIIITIYNYLFAQYSARSRVILKRPLGLAGSFGNSCPRGARVFGMQGVCLKIRAPLKPLGTIPPLWYTHQRISYVCTPALRKIQQQKRYVWVSHCNPSKLAYFSRYFGEESFLSSSKCTVEMCRITRIPMARFSVSLCFRIFFSEQSKEYNRPRGSRLVLWCLHGARGGGP